MIHHVIEAVRKDIAALDAEVPKAGDLLDLALALDEVRTAKAELDMVERDLQGAVIRSMGTCWETSIDGFGGIRVRGGKERKKWRHDEVWPLAIRQARIVGPLPGTEEGEAETAMRVVRSALQPAYWRAKVLKGWGVDPDEFCEVSWGRKSVELIK